MCGIVGYVGGRQAYPILIKGLTRLEYRGYDSAGVALIGDSGELSVYKTKGKVRDLEKLASDKDTSGCIGIAHTRWATHGEPNDVNSHPHYSENRELALIHNGIIENYQSLKTELTRRGYHFQSQTDTEVVIQLIQYMMDSRGVSFEEAVPMALNHVIGAYALVIMSPKKLMGLRDPFGLKPLCLGKRGNAYVLASESCALTATGATFIRDIEPGELVTISAEGIESDDSLQQEKCAHCIFEYIYFARLDSCIDGVSVYDARIAAGKALAESHPVAADLVTGVPESGLPAAKGYAEASGIPFGFAFYKNSYIGRTFIKPSQEERENSVHMKLSVLQAAVAGKRIVLIDDSIVRGTTMKHLVQMLKDAGAREVHVRISSPPFRHPCYFGTDVSSGEELIANHYSLEDIRQILDADSLGYLDIHALSEMVKGLPICTACFDGNYPMEIPALISPPQSSRRL